MSLNKISCCSLILKENFGEVIDKVGCHLMSKGGSALREIVNQTGLPLQQVPNLIIKSNRTHSLHLPFHRVSVQCPLSDVDSTGTRRHSMTKNAHSAGTRCSLDPGGGVLATIPHYPICAQAFHAKPLCYADPNIPGACACLFYNTT